MSRYLSLPFAALALMPAAARAYPARPERIEAPDACTKYYPAGSQAQGATLLVFDLAPGGSAELVKVAQSSGDAALDAAAVSCVSGFHYRNAARQKWREQINWRFDGKQGSAMAYIPHSCAGFYPKDEFKQGIEGVTTLSFVVDTEGKLDDIKVAAGSGNDNLDKAAVACVSRWHYSPATDHGVPVASPWQTKVEWKIPKE